MTKFALPHLQKSRGNIVSVGSEAGLIGIAQNTPCGEDGRLSPHRR